mgnify:CR=1 FL=1
MRETEEIERFGLSLATTLSIGNEIWPIEVTLTDRDDMRFRMLLGRTAIEHRALVNVAESYLLGKRPKRKQREPHPTSKRVSSGQHKE